MAELSDYYENMIINHMLRNLAFTPPTAVWAALFTAVTGLEGNNPTAEVSGGSYARVAIPLAAASGGASSNNADLTFTTASADWGTVTHAAVVDAQTNTVWGAGVNVLMWSSLDANKTVNTSDTFKFNNGDLDVTVD